VRYLPASRRFYEAALAPLGFDLLHSDEGQAGFGLRGRDRSADDFWVMAGDAPHTGIHVAFAAPDRAAVDAFHAAALASGGRDNGAPGLRPEYHAGYYAAFVLDPDGNNVEAVCHDRRVPG
jgi:catechol 2,3-dioxygenase-like lactoylglutathione lyase family enzyme